MERQFKVECFNIMGMPTDTVTCNWCGEHKQVYGRDTWLKMKTWEVEHSEVCKGRGEG